MEGEQVREARDEGDAGLSWRGVLAYATPLQLPHCISCHCIPCRCISCRCISCHCLPVEPSFEWRHDGVADFGSVLLPPTRLDLPPGAAAGKSKDRAVIRLTSYIQLDPTDSLVLLPSIPSSSFSTTSSLRSLLGQRFSASHFSSLRRTHRRKEL